MKMKKYASFDDYLDDQPSKNRSIIRALRRFVKRAEPGLEERVRLLRATMAGAAETPPDKK